MDIYFKTWLIMGPLSENESVNNLIFLVINTDVLNRENYCLKQKLEKYIYIYSVCSTNFFKLSRRI
jgi:hypothetical protein